MIKGILLTFLYSQVHWADDGAKKWDYQMKRVQLSFSKKGNNILSSLETHNRKLRELLDSNEKLESMKASRKDTTWANVFECIRKHASSIHIAIRTGFCCGCSIHSAALRLEHRQTGDWSSPFNLAFSIPKDSDAGVKARREVILKIRKNEGVDEATKSKPSQPQMKDMYSGMASLRTNFESKSSPQLHQSPARPRPALSSSLSGSLGLSSRIKFRERFSKNISGSSNSNGTECLLEEVQTT